MLLMLLLLNSCDLTALCCVDGTVSQGICLVPIFAANAWIFEQHLGKKRSNVIGGFPDTSSSSLASFECVDRVRFLGQQVSAVWCFALEERESTRDRIPAAA